MAKRFFTFHETETSTAEGNILLVKNTEEIMTLNIETDATSLTVLFEALVSESGNDTDWTPFICYNYNNASTGVQTTSATNEKWQVEIGAITKFRARITVQTGGTGTTIIGKVDS